MSDTDTQMSCDKIEERKAQERGPEFMEDSYLRKDTDGVWRRYHSGANLYWDDEFMNDIINRFSFHPATEDTGPMHDDVRERCLHMAEEFATRLPRGRETSLAITKLEEAMMWANASVARNQEATS